MPHFIIIAIILILILNCDLLCQAQHLFIIICIWQRTFFIVSGYHSSFNKLTNSAYTTAKCWCVCFCWDMLISETCQLSTSALVFDECHWLACTDNLLAGYTTRLVDNIGHGFGYICDRLSAMGPPCTWANLLRK